MSWFLVILALMAANFGYQYYTDKDWELASERTFFQAVAVLAVFLSKPWM